jgi:ribulose-5-phosphate 4-epimerase/fuculose-1-phosphate aldolase
MTTVRGQARSEGEVRRDLAAAFRLAQLAGWDDTIYTHLSAAVPAEEGHYLINEFGLAFEEVTASNLVKVNLKGAMRFHGRLQSASVVRRDPRLHRFQPFRR